MLRVVSLLAVVVASIVLVRRGDAQWCRSRWWLTCRIGSDCRAVQGPERRYLLTLFLVAFAVRMVAAVAIHPYLVVVTHDKQGQTNGRWVGFLFEDDRAYHKVAWGLSGYWLGRENGGVDRSDFYLLRMYTYIVAWLYEYVYLVSPASLAAQSSDKIGSAVVMAPKLMNCFVGAFTIVPMYALGRELGPRPGRPTRGAGDGVLAVADPLVDPQPQGHHGRYVDRGDHVPGASLCPKARAGSRRRAAGRVRFAGEHAAVRLRLRLACADHVLPGEP